MPSGILRARTATVQLLSQRATRGTLQFGHLSLPCAVGKTGVSALKHEGDGASPMGTWRLEQLFYRADRVQRPRTSIPIRAMTQRDAWCDIAGDRNYNRLVQIPYPVIDEQLWRDDHLYDVVGVLSYNRLPRVQWAGSAIFLHGARPGYLPTAGCVALSMPDLIRLVEYEPGMQAIRFG